MAKFFLLFTALLFTACAPVARKPITAADLENPQVPGIKGARYWADATPPDVNDLLDLIQLQQRASGFSGNTTLTLSGGGENGAFAAGILTAWSEAGTRPEFSSVTGVSTGALAAPFAFLGTKFDDELRRLYGGLPPANIFESRSIFGIFNNASIKSTGPLKELLEDYITDDFLAMIAREHQRGRRLLVQSVSLDAQRPVLWDLGAIASSGAPNAKDVFRDALLASASIPGVFPPVLIDVAGASGIRDELHVDGGVYSQTAFASGWDIPNRYIRGGKTYAIRNGKVTPELQATKLGLADVSKRSLATLVKAQGVDDLVLIYQLSRQRGSSFNAAWIGSDFTFPLNEPFDPEYMAALFNYGYQRFKSGNLWNDTPPR